MSFPRTNGDSGRPPLNCCVHSASCLFVCERTCLLPRSDRVSTGKRGRHVLQREKPTYNLVTLPPPPHIRDTSSLELCRRSRRLPYAKRQGIIVFQISVGRMTDFLSHHPCSRASPTSHNVYLRQSLLYIPITWKRSPTPTPLRVCLPACLPAAD